MGKRRDCHPSLLLQLRPSEAPGDSKSGVDLRVHRAEAAVEDRKVHSYLQSQCCLETWKAGHLGLRGVVLVFFGVFVRQLFHDLCTGSLTVETCVG